MVVCLDAGANPHALLSHSQLTMLLLQLAASKHMEERSAVLILLQVWVSTKP